MKKSAMIGFMILAVLAAPAQAGGLTLKECLQAALAENPSFKESRLAVSASEQGVESAEGRRYPRLSHRCDPGFPAGRASLYPRTSLEHTLPISAIPSPRGGRP